MKQSIFHRLSSILWGAIVVMIVVLAVYVSMGRLVTSLTGSYQKEILQELNHRVPFFIDADKVSAQWRSFTPVVVLEGLSLTLPGELEQSIELSEGRIAVDVAGSLASRSLHTTMLRLKGLELAGELDRDGSLRLRGFHGGDAQLGEWLESFLLNVERLALDDARITLQLPDGDQRHFTLDLGLSRDGSHRQLRAALASSHGLAAQVLGEGVGNPFEPGAFSGQLYFDLAAPDMTVVTGLLGELLGGRDIAGAIDLAMWFNWEQGHSRPGVEFSVGMDGVLLSSSEAGWEIPLDRMQFEAGLVDRRGGWGLEVVDMQLERGASSLQLPRLQLLSRGETLKVRAQSLPLAPLAELLAGTDLLPPAAAQLLVGLQPQGSLSTLELDVADIGAPMADWQLAANFSGLAVLPWENAPGVAGATGYLQLKPGYGFVVLDSQQFSMQFPTVYGHALQFDDFHGTFYLDWSEELVTLSSGLVQARGSEGRVPVKFGLSVPLTPSDVGIEMELLVGLENTDSSQRDKYIPQVLAPELREWLASSIDDGHIEQGGFLWRGSLTGELPALHTVQLFFNVRGASLDYHPQWPSLSDVDGTVLIDNSDVSVWAKSARLLDSVVSNLSVELWNDPSDALWLAVEGSVAGPAADGLAVINDSPLSAYLGGVFVDATLRGELATAVDLRMNLDDATASPEVTVSSNFTEVELDLVPGELPFRDIYGALDYTTELGLVSRDLGATLWGQPVQVRVGQQTLALGPGPEANREVVAIELSSALPMADLQLWLGLEDPVLAEGRAGVDARILAAPGQGVSLFFDSDLVGVGLDLPFPWGKAADTPRPLQVSLEMTDDDWLLDIDLAGDMQAQVQIAQGRVRAASLAVDSEPQELSPGLLRVTGHVEYADTAEWERIYNRYLAGRVDGHAPESTVSAELSGPDTPSPAGVDSAALETPEPERLRIAVDHLQFDQLVAGGRQLGTITLGLSEQGEDWQLRADADWLRGSFRYRVGAPSLLDIDYLDIARLNSLPEVNPQDGEAETGDLPVLDVTVGELRHGETLLGNLAFTLYDDGENIHAQNISGQIAAMQIRSSTPASLVWRQGERGHTTLNARLNFMDFGDTLEQLGYQRIIVTEDGSFQLALDWPGGPQDFSLQAAQGSLLVDIGAGTFPDISGPASGTLRVVSILNLTEIVQRLSLTHMFEAGVPFDKVDGEVILERGTIDVAKMNVEGGASSFQFTGISEVASRSLDGELVVTLPVASNLPWVAAFTAGLPVAAGVFVLSKMFESQVNRLTSAVYSTTGTWDDPVVNFDRVFDDTATGDTTSPETEGEAGITQPVVP